MKIKLKRLRLRKGDILLVKKTFDNLRESERLVAAGRSLNLGFDVPIVFVEKLNDYKVKHNSPIVTAEMLQMSMEGPDPETTDWERTAANLTERLAK